MAKKCSEEEVITALMAAPTITGAAQLLGVSRQTVYNYLASEGFEEKLQAAIRARDEQLTHLRETASAEAIAYLVGVVRNDDFWDAASTKERIEAAKTLLTFGASGG